MGHDERLHDVVVLEGNEHGSLTSKPDHDPSSAFCTSLPADIRRTQRQSCITESGLRIGVAEGGPGSLPGSSSNYASVATAQVPWPMPDSQTPPLSFLPCSPANPSAISLASLSGQLDGSAKASSSSSPTCSTSDQRIAIIGMALRMPGASDPEQLWKLIDSGSSSLAKIPFNRFNAPDYREGKVPGKVLNVYTGNFLTDVEGFDNEFFKISPREARMMDPQQRLLLHVAHEALEDAGYIRHSSSSTDPNHVGVFIGAATNDYVHNVRDEIGIHYVSGTLPAFLSGRISYSLALGGPSVTLDTACSSSAIALHSATRALCNGDAKMALAGGVSIITSPDVFIGLDTARFLNRSGQPTPFDSEANGYSRGEGCGIFVLKRMRDALLDNDRILGIIHGIEANQSYGNSSITRTHSPTQAVLLHHLLDRARVQPEDVSVVEAHAAGTKQGDSAELLAIQDVFLAGGDRRFGPLHVSSIKASIGHLEAASGAASVAKVLLMLKHQSIPRQIGVQTLNPIVANIPSNLLVIPSESTPWLRRDDTTPRRAVVNNYGAAGSNVSILLEEYIDDRYYSGSEDIENMFFGMSAPNKDALEEIRSRYLSWLQEPSTHPSLFDLCYTSTARRRQCDYRLSFPTPNNRDEFTNQLATSPIVKVDSLDTRVVFVYPGQGCQYPGMGAAFYATCPIFKAHIDSCNEILIEHRFPTFLPYLLGGPDSTEVSSVVEQTALFAFEVALSMLWKSWGISCSAAIGHSLGEYAALVTSGVVDLKDALLLVGGRARLVQQRCTPKYSGMLLVPLTLDAIEGIIQDAGFADVVVACSNSRDRHTVGGPLSQLEPLKILLEDKYDIRAKFLSSKFAYHTPAMRPMLKEFEQLMEDTVFKKPSIPLASTVTGSVLSLDDEVVTSTHLLRHCKDIVRFREAIDSLSKYLETPATNVCWIEIAPRRTLLSLVRNTYDGPKSSMYLDSMLHQGDPWKTLADGLSSLYTTRIDVNWKSVFSSFGQPRCIALPAYPFQSRPFWVPYREPSSLSNSATPRNQASNHHATTSSFSIVQPPSVENGHQAVFSLSSSHVATYSQAHVVASVPICPASIYIEAVLSGLSMMSDHSEQQRPSYFAIHQAEFIKPLFPGQSDPTATISITRVDPLNYEFVLHSHSPGEGILGSSGLLHTRGRCLMRQESEMPERFHLGLPCIQERIRLLDPSVNRRVDVFSSKTIYEVIFSRVVRYANFLRSLDRIIIAEDQQEGYALMQISPSNDEMGGDAPGGIVNPVYLDGMVHFAGFIVNLQGGPNDLFVCVGIGSLEILPGSFLTKGYSKYQLYTTVSSLTQDSFLAETVVLALDPPRIIARLKNINFKRVALHAFASHAPTTSSFQSTSASVPHQSVSSKDVAPSNGPTVVDSAHSPLKSILEDSLHIPRGRIREHSTLDSLGLDSLTSVEILHTIRKTHGLSLPVGFLQDHFTVGDVETAIKRLLPPPSPPSPPSSSSCIEQLQSALPGKTPICFVHDGTGLTAPYQKLLALGRAVWAIRDPKMRISDDGWGSVADMASFYADSVLNTIPGDDLILAGWSFGGVVAYELARQLQLRGKSVKGIILLDSPPPSGKIILSDNLINQILGDDTHLSSATRTILQHQFRKHVQIMSRHRGSKLDTPVPCVFIRCSEGYSASQILDVHEWFTSRDDAEKTVAEWKDLVGESLSVVDVPGHHFEMFRSSKLESTSKAVLDGCTYVERRGTSILCDSV